MMNKTKMAAMLCVGALSAGQARAHDEIMVLHDFGASGNMPYGNITFSHRQLFGTTSYGGSNTCSGGCGTVYRLSPRAGGSHWAFETLYSFQGAADGGNPYAQLTVGPGGEIYGYTATTTQGTVFKLVPPAQQGGRWSFQTLYTFKNGADGNLTGVYAPLVIKGSRIYGIASGGSPSCGAYGCGSLFRLDPPSNGQGSWTLLTVHAFSGGNDTGQPNSLTPPDASGAFYASTSLTSSNGAVVQLAPNHGHQSHYASRIIATFHGGNFGFYSPYNLLLAPSGVVYGLSAAEGGQVFSLTPPAEGNGRWVTSELARVVADGFYPPSSLAFGPSGSLIGVIYGDQDIDFGHAFQVSPPAGGTGAWTYGQLWNFNYGPDQNPNNIVTGDNGDLFGVLSGGGYQNGAVFKLQR